MLLATGLGKTWLAAFDAERCGARRILFVAHREEILQQAAQTFLRIRPNAKIGFYMGQHRDVEVDVLCASVQTLSRNAHLERFSPKHFDYIVIDEFHHAAAATYRRLLSYFSPRFLLGLTATPDRTDQSDILSLCDDNLVFSYPLFEGIRSNLLAPFHYFGIFDDTVDYHEVPWRNGRFDPDQLSNKLATLARARHVLKQWRERAQQRTLAFCVSIRHADFMAEQFSKAGISAAPVYAGSPLSRADALERLRDKRLSAVFSVDLFNEGVDVPEIDTVMLLRPTESKILFLQQLGRGLRKTSEKDKLVVLDFVGNHQSFLHKPQALLGIGPNYFQLAEFARKVEQQRLDLPDGCFVNYDLQLIEFLKSLDSQGLQKEYKALKEGLSRRPSLSEFFRAGSSVQRMRQQYGSWFEFVMAQGDLDADDAQVIASHQEFLREVEKTSMTKSFKMVLLEALLELRGFHQPLPLSLLAERSWQVLQRRRPLLTDISEQIQPLENGTSTAWQRYWFDNPVKAWIGDNRLRDADSFFQIVDGCFTPLFTVTHSDQERLTTLLQELVDYRLAAYELRQRPRENQSQIILFPNPGANKTELPYFPDLKIACGHFKTGLVGVEEYRSVGPQFGELRPERHFIARASGNSMNGGKSPIRNGDYLLLERILPTEPFPKTETIMAVERENGAGNDSQFLLRVLSQNVDGAYILKANNPEYDDLAVTPEMRMTARLKAVIDSLQLAIGRPFMREDIPPLFGEKFNPGNWNSGHVVFNNGKTHILLVTLNKQGKAEDHRYLDHWIDNHTFHWQSQNSTSPTNKRGREVIEEENLGTSIHLFVRESKLKTGKAAPFIYYGKVRYRSHSGSNPMNVIFEVAEAIH